MIISGTTALIALLEDNKLTIANVGDSRGVMCDGKGNAIPLSFDHKPQQVFIPFYNHILVTLKLEFRIVRLS